MELIMYDLLATIINRGISRRYIMIQQDYEFNLVDHETIRLIKKLSDELGVTPREILTMEKPRLSREVNGNDIFIKTENGKLWFWGGEFHPFRALMLEDEKCLGLDEKGNPIHKKG
jgi:hypothetical protein